MRPPSHVLAETNVPRYTSYPTAPHFTPAIGASAYADWLAQLSPDERLSLYIHVPFCTELCLYCGCNTKAVRRRSPIESYARNLLSEIELLGRTTPARKVSHLHWGGGTPSLLDSALLSEIAAALAATFDLSTLREHAIELDPRSLTVPLARTLHAIGVTRASLGVQDFTPDVQKAIGRIQPYDVVKRAAETLREAGIADLNFDLMYGLPKQGLEDVRRSISLATELRPSRIALFGYAHVPWFKTHQRLIQDADLPGAALRLEQIEAARETLLARGYEAIGFDHFALPDDGLARAARRGGLHRNFQGYTDDDAATLIGLGASAIGRLPQGFVQNAPDVSGYARAVSAGQFATCKGIAVTADDRLRAHVIERLMCDLYVDLPAIALEHGATEPFEQEIETLRPLEREGLVSVNDGRVTVTPAGRNLVRLIASAFDLYLRRSQRRHSVAV